jgi:hypothetical protein
MACAGAPLYPLMCEPQHCNQAPKYTRGNVDTLQSRCNQQCSLDCRINHEKEEGTNFVHCTTCAGQDCVLPQSNFLRSCVTHASTHDSRTTKLLNAHNLWNNKQAAATPRQECASMH